MAYRTIVSVVAFSCALLACAEEPSSTPDGRTAYNVHGVFKLEGEPRAENISVELAGATVITASTDNSGAFALNGVPKGSYVLRARAASFLEHEESVVVGLAPDTQLGVRTLPLLRAPIRGDALVEEIDADEKTTRRRGGVTITVQITDTAHGNPVTQPSDYSYVTVSAPDGAYQIADVPAGTYEVVATYPGAEPITLEHLVVSGAGAVGVEPIVLQPLTGFFEIEGQLASGEKSNSYTSSQLVTLRLTGFQALRMKVGTSPTGAPSDCIMGAAEEYIALKSFSLPQAGKNTVCVVYIADNGRQTEPLVETIIFDDAPPVAPFIELNYGASYSKSNQLAVRVGAVDVLTGVRSMQVSPDPTFVTAVEQEYTPGFVVAGSAVDGRVTLWARFADAAGNYSAAVSASITIDTLPPAVTLFQVEDAAGNPLTLTNALRVWVRLAAADASGLEMRISSRNDFQGSVWQPYQSLVQQDLLPAGVADGELRTLYAQVRDGAGWTSGVFSFQFTLDTQIPRDATIYLATSPVSSPTVSVALSASNADFVELSGEIGFVSPVRFAFQAVTSFTFSGGDGLKTLYARYFDLAGNVSPVVAATTQLDQSPPVLTALQINAGAGAVTSILGTVTLSLTAFDESGVTAAEVANLSSSACAIDLAATAPEPMLANRTWVLAAPGSNLEGNRTVCARFRDAAGNWSAPVSDTVWYDTLAPVISGAGIVINGGATYATSLLVALDLPAAGATEMMVGTDGSFAGSGWEPYRSSTLWILPDVQGAHSVDVKYRDGAGNVAGPFPAYIEVDTIPPSAPTVALNGGAPCANTSAVDIDLSAIGAAAVRLSNDGDFALGPSYAYAVQLTGWALASGDGVRSVFAQFSDAAGNLSAVVMDSLVVDTVAPQNAGFSIDEAPVTPLLTVHLQLMASEAVEMQIAEDACGGLWIPYSPAASYDFQSSTDGVKNIAVRFRDVAGNPTACLIEPVLLDTTAPHVTSISPRTASTGPTVYINGINFGVSQGLSAVSFGDIAASVSYWSNTEIRTSVPDGVGPGATFVVVTVDGKSSQPASFTILPAIEKTTPYFGAIDTQVTLTGTNFGAPVTGSQVLVNAIPAIVDTWTPNAITARLPAGVAPGLAALAVSSKGVASIPAPFYVPASLENLAPNAGPPGTAVLITGHGFGVQQGNGRVVFGGVEAAVTSWSDDSIEAVVPAAAPAGTLEVQVTAREIGSNRLAFEHERPWIDERFPNHATSGSVVSLGGRYFGTVSGAVEVSGLPTTVLAWTPTLVQCRMPPGLVQGPATVVLHDAAAHTSNGLPLSIRGRNVWLADDVPVDFRNHAAVWTGTEMLLWGGTTTGSDYLNTGGRYNPATDTWISTTLANAPTGRQNHTAIWTGREMIVWGGRTGSTAFTNDGAKYSVESDSWSSINIANAPTAREGHAAVWNGFEMIVWGGSTTASLNTGGRYNPATDLWRATTTNNAPAQRTFPAAVWTGYEMIVWGGASAPGCCSPLNTGGRYFPSIDAWVPMTTVNAPSPRVRAATVWTGHEMIAWGGGNSITSGGSTATGGRYDPIADMWSTMNTTGAPAARNNASAVWTGAQLIIWGGDGSPAYLQTGAVYNPSLDAWLGATATLNAPAGRNAHSAVWTGDRMAVWGGADGASARPAGGGQYEPTTDTWEQSGIGNLPVSRIGQTQVWTGSEMIVWGGRDASLTSLDSGARYNPATHTWRPTSSVGTPSPRYEHTAAWTGDKMIVWGGYSSGSRINTGAQYNPSLDAWYGVATTGAPTARVSHTAVWTGTHMIVWGGTTTSGDTDTGGKYSPISNTWIDTSRTSVPTSRACHAAVWTGAQMIVWGGGCVDPYPNSGSRYDPESDVWTATTTSGAPAGRGGFSAVWSGTEMIIWGGTLFGNMYQNTGARYDPASDTWTAMSVTNAPAARQNHTAVWAGAEMLIWGGNFMNSGGRYNPSNDSWTSMVVSPLVGRENHAAVWSGSTLLIWGGCTSNCTSASPQLLSDGMQYVP